MFSYCDFLSKKNLKMVLPCPANNSLFLYSRPMHCLHAVRSTANDLTRAFNPNNTLETSVGPRIITNIIV